MMLNSKKIITMFNKSSVDLLNICNFLIRLQMPKNRGKDRC